MAMLQKERWIFDSKRGLPRDTRNPQQSDQDLRSFLEVPEKEIISVEDDFVIPGKKKRGRGRGKASTPANDINFDEVFDVHDSVPDKKPRKVKSTKESISSDIFSDSTNKRAKDKTVPPLPPGPKAPPQISSDDMDAMLDAKLEKMFAVIAKNQSNMEKSFVKALEEQRKEFTFAQKAAAASSKNSASNVSSSGGLNFSPSTSFAGIIIHYVYRVYYY